MDNLIRMLTTYEQVGWWIGILLLGIAMVGLLWVVLRRLIHRWQRNFTTRLGEIQMGLKRMEEVTARVTVGRQGLAPHDPEPYGPLVGDLLALQAGIDQAREGMVAQLHFLGREALPAPAGRLARLWFGFWPEPRYWWQRRRATETLWQATQEPQAQAGQAELLLETLRSLPQQLAHRCQDLYAVSDRVNQLSQALYASGVHGPLLDEAADELKGFETRLKALPVYFFQSPEPAAAGATDKEAVIGAWQTLAKIEPSLREHLEQFQTWQKEYEAAGRQLQAMRQAVETARQRLGQVPAEIDASSHLTEFEQAAAEAEELEARYRAPALEILTGLAERMSGVAEVSIWLAGQSDSLAEKSDRLRALALSGAALLAEIEGVMTETAGASSYPLVWTEGQAELERLRKLQSSLGSPDLRRTPAELERHVTIAAGLLSGGTALKNTVLEIKAQRDRLVPFLDRPELAPERSWLGQAETLSEQTRSYAPKNWPAGDALPRLRDDARQLAGRHQDLIPPGASQALPAEAVELMLDEVEELLTETEVFLARLGRIQENLAALQQIENETRQKLTVTLQALEQISKTWPGPAVPLGPGPAGYQAQLNKLQQDGRKHMAALGKPKSGQVKEKDREVTTWIKSCAAALQALQAELLVEIKRLAERLEGEIESLRKIAPFDRERTVREAGQLLQTTALPHAILLGAGQGQVELLAEGIKVSFARAETYQQSLDRLTSQVTERVRPPLQKLGEVRQKALAAVEMLKQNTGPDAWPPVVYDLRPLTGPLDQIEADLARLAHSGRTTGDVLATLEAGIKRCEGLLARANRDLGALKAEQSRAQVILDQVDGWQRKLELYRARHYEDAALVKAINDQLNLIAEKRAEARRPHLSPGQVERILDDLQRLAYQNLRVARDGKTETVSVAQIE